MISPWKLTMRAKSLCWNARFAANISVHNGVLEMKLCFEVFTRCLLKLMIIIVIKNGFPWILTEPKNSYRWVPMISVHGTETLFTMQFEILGLVSNMYMINSGLSIRAVTHSTCWLKPAISMATSEKNFSSKQWEVTGCLQPVQCHYTATRTVSHLIYQSPNYSAMFPPWCLTNT